MLKNRTEQIRNDEKYSKTDITDKIHSNCDGVRATANVLRSIPASLSWRSPVIAVKEAAELTSADLRVNSRSGNKHSDRSAAGKVVIRTF